MDNRSHKNSAGKSSSVSNPREKNPSRKKRRVSTPVLVMRAIFLVLLVALTGVGICMVTVKPGDDEMNAYRDNGKFYDGISISGLDISGLTFDEAWDLVAPKVKQDLAAFNVTVRVDNRIWLLSANDIGVTVTLEQVLMEAMSLGRGDTAVNNLAVKNNLAQEGASFTVGYQLSDESKLRGVVEGIAELVDTAPIDAIARPIRTSSEPSFDYVEGERGRRLNVDDIVSDIKTAISESNAPVEVSPEFEYVEPELTVDDLKGLTELRATYQTSYGTSSSLKNFNRIRNIQKTADILNGCRVEVGQEISFNEYIGPRYEKDGWLLAPGIVNGSRYVNQAGGGICQVSTTLYNALLLCGPEIEFTERKKHSWPSSYLDYGLDATVSTGGPDLKFANKTEAPIYIFAYADNVNYIMTVYIYGAPLPEGITYKTEGITEAVIPPQSPEYVYVSEWPEGYRETDITARDGYRATAYRYKYKDGELVETEKLYTDNYNPVRGKIKVGTGDPRLPKPQ